MKHNILLKIGGLLLSTIMVTSLAACSSNHQNSKESKTPSTKTESTKDNNSEEDKSEDTKKDDTATSTDQNKSGQAVSHSANQQKRVPVKNHNATQSGQVQATNKNTNKHSQPTAIIQNSNQAAALVAHANASSVPEAWHVKKLADGYHVWFDTGSANPIVTVVKSNGDFYDVNGNFVGSYAKMSAPDALNKNSN